MTAIGYWALSEAMARRAPVPSPLRETGFSHYVSAPPIHAPNFFAQVTEAQVKGYGWT